MVKISFAVAVLIGAAKAAEATSQATVVPSFVPEAENAEAPVMEEYP